MNKERYQEAERRLLLGEVIAFPTETFFGLGTNPSNRKAVGELLRLKSRAAGEGIPLIAADRDSAASLFHALNDQALELRHLLEDTFWPGPLTLVGTVCGKGPELAEGVCGPGNTAAVRVSSSSEATEMARAAGGLITATSANPKGKEPPRGVEKVREYFPGMFVYGTTAGADDILLPSTLIDITKLPFVVLREGAISYRRLKDCLGAENIR